jgi:HD-like signal output (HDOD) protein/CheY-like chemotaxis protein
MKRILFVDDEANILEGLRRTFRTARERWEMQFVVGAEEALRAFEAGTFDVIVSDMRMPGMDGATLLEIIRDRYPDTARIVLSGYSEEVLSMHILAVAHRCLSKPCDPLELREAIENVCLLRDVINADKIRKIVGGVSELPSLSATYTRLLKVIQNPKTSIGEVVNLIEKDVAMSAKILQVANSAYFGLPKKAANLQGAAMYLGMATIKNLVFATEVFRVFTPHASLPKGFCEDLQLHSFRSAQIAGALPVHHEMRDIVFIAALLHDSGKLLLASAMPEAYSAILKESQARNVAQFEVEEGQLGTTHAEIGAYLLGLWGIPFPAVEAIAHHHRPARYAHGTSSQAPLLNATDAVYCANLLAHELEEHPNDDQGNELSEYARSYLGESGLLPFYADFRQRAVQAVAHGDSIGQS